jgi:hypothetical protein
MHVRRPTGMTSRNVALVAAFTLLLTACTAGEGHPTSPAQATSSASAVLPTSTASAPSTTPPTTPASTSPAGGGVTSTGAKLEVLSPRPGQTITLPAQIQYRATGVAVPSGAVLRLTVRDLQPIDLPVTASTGTVTLPDDKSSFLPGNRDLTFQLITRGGTPLTLAVTVHNVIIEGRRGA